MQIARHFQIKSVYHYFENRFNNNYGFNCTVGILISTLMGSIAVMYSMMSGNGLFEWIQISTATIICSAYNASVISVQPNKIVLNLLILSTILNLLIIIYNLGF
ncbi:MAG: hypothetical protein CMC54_03575 [Flavobacteriaceae bacterium]|nr:hypothetical protein [Flavobacteriaceae bacterium]